MAKVIIDSDLYVDWINRGLHEDVVLRDRSLRFMSSIVLMELRAGAFTRRDQRIIQRLYNTFSRVRRLLVPTERTFWEAGSVLQRLQQEHGILLRGRTRLVNDTLIALSARQIGATVLTHNARDFETIRHIRAFNLTIVPVVHPPV